MCFNLRKLLFLPPRAVVLILFVIGSLASAQEDCARIVSVQLRREAGRRHHAAVTRCADEALAQAALEPVINGTEPVLQMVIEHVGWLACEPQLKEAKAARAAGASGVAKKLQAKPAGFVHAGLTELGCGLLLEELELADAADIDNGLPDKDKEDGGGAEADHHHGAGEEVDDSVEEEEEENADMPNLVDDSEDSEDEEEDNFLSAGEKLNATMPPPHAHLPLEVEVGQGIVFSLSTPPTPPTPPTPLDTARHPRHSTLDTLDTPTTSEHPGRQDRRRHSLDTLDTLDTGVNRHTLDTPSTLTRHSLDTRSTHSTPLTPRHTRAQAAVRASTDAR